MLIEKPRSFIYQVPPMWCIVVSVNCLHCCCCCKCRSPFTVQEKGKEMWSYRDERERKIFRHSNYGHSHRGWVDTQWREALILGHQTPPTNHHQLVYSLWDVNQMTIMLKSILKEFNHLTVIRGDGGVIWGNLFRFCAMLIQFLRLSRLGSSTSVICHFSVCNLPLVMYSVRFIFSSRNR